VVDDQAVKLVKIPKSLMEQLADYRDDKGTLLDRDYDLKRTGSGKNDTKYRANPDSPSKMKLSRFTKLDHDAVLLSLLGEVDEVDEDEDEKPSKRQRPSKSKNTTPWEDDEEEIEETWDDLEEMSRSELRAFNKEHDLGVRFVASKDDDELREEVAEAADIEIESSSSKKTTRKRSVRRARH
jgi:hypothetical protein